MKVLFVTSITYPDIGGPALYARYLPPELKGFGIKTRVVSLPKLPKIIREFIYVANLSIYIPRHDIVYALSASPVVVLPAAILSKLFRKKIILRPGGDFLWERYTRKAENPIGLDIFYKSGEYKRHVLLYKIFLHSLQMVDIIVFPTVFLKNLYKEYYSLEEQRCAFIDYPFPDIKKSAFKPHQEKEKQFLFTGRLIRFKNADRLIQAFADISNRGGIKLKIIGEGPQKNRLINLVKTLGLEGDVIFQDKMPHEQLLDEILKSYCVVIPSVFEPGSFLALECLKLKIPIIFTKNAGLHDVYRDTILFVDPHSIEDIKEKLEFLLDDENYKDYLSIINKLNTERGWEEVADEHVNIFKKITK